MNVHSRSVTGATNHYPSLALSYTAVLTVALLIPADTEWHATRQNVYLALNDTLPWRAFLRDVIVNVGAFVPIGILWDAVLGARRPSLLRRASLLVCAAAAFAFAIESLQYLFAWRASSLIDVLSDTAGTALGIALHRSTHLWTARNPTPAHLATETSKM